MNVSKKKVNFGDLSIGDLFYLEKSEDVIIECEKLANNLSEDELGNTILLLSSDVVIIEPLNN